MTTAKAFSTTAEPSEGRRSAPADSTEELVQMSFRLTRSRWKKLRALGIEECTSVQSIILAALEREFALRGLPF